MALPGDYKGLTRGQASVAVQSRLVEQGLYHGEQEQEEEVVWSDFGDLVCVRDRRDVRRPEGEINLRKPVLIVSSGENAANVSFSSNINIHACDNKVICDATGRTGGYCTGCSCCEKDMHGDRCKEPYYLDMGIGRVWEKFEELKVKWNFLDQREEEVEIPYRRGDYKQRVGVKRAPLTTQLDPTGVSVVWKYIVV